MIRKTLAFLFIVTFVIGQPPFSKCGLGLLPCCCDNDEKISISEPRIAQKSKACCSSHDTEPSEPVEKNSPSQKENDTCKCEINDSQPVDNSTKNVLLPTDGHFVISLTDLDEQEFTYNSHVVFTTGPPGPKQHLYILYQHLLL